MRKVSLALTGLVLGLLVLGQVGTGQDKGVAGKNHTVEIQDGKYVPDKLTVAVGDTVTWLNKDNKGHSATADKKDDANFFDTKEVAGGKSSAPVTFKKAGDVPYHCAAHPTMKGTVTVK